MSDCIEVQREASTYLLILLSASPPAFPQISLDQLRLILQGESGLGLLNEGLDVFFLKHRDLFLLGRQLTADLVSQLLLTLLLANTELSVEAIREAVIGVELIVSIMTAHVKEGLKQLRADRLESSLVQEAPSLGSLREVLLV